jgi:hypothetical protein
MEIPDKVFMREIKTGIPGYYWLVLAEGHLHRSLFAPMLRRIWALPVPSG